MGRHTTIIPISSVHALLKAETNAEVSKEAAQIVEAHLEELGMAIAKLAHQNAAHRGKKTIEAQDVTLAVKQMEK